MVLSFRILLTLPVIETRHRWVILTGAPVDTADLGGTIKETRTEGLLASSPRSFCGSIRNWPSCVSLTTTLIRT